MLQLDYDQCSGVEKEKYTTSELKKVKAAVEKQVKALKKKAGDKTSTISTSSASDRQKIASVLMSMGEEGIEKESVIDKLEKVYKLKESDYKNIIKKEKKASDVKLRQDYSVNKILTGTGIPILTSKYK